MAAHEWSRIIGFGTAMARRECLRCGVTVDPGIVLLGTEVARDMLCPNALTEDERDTLERMGVEDP